jgi:hypothetical protein
MKTTLALLLALASPALLAQTLHFGEPAPLATTRYGAFGGEVRLTSNGTDTFLAWSADGKVRMTRLTDGERRVGRPVLDVVPYEPDSFDVVWTGEHFLVAAQQCIDDTQCTIAGQLVDRTGEPLAHPFTIEPQRGRPRLTFDGTRVLMVYGPSSYKSVFLDRDGRSPSRRVEYGSVSSSAAAAAAADGTSVVVTPEFGSVHILALNTEAAVVGTPQFTVPHREDRRVAVASGNGEFFILWTNGDAPMEAAVIKASNATISGRFTLPDTGGTAAIAAAYDGERWVITWITGGEAHVRRVTKNNASSENLSSQLADDDSPVAAFSVNGHTTIAWRGKGEGAPINVRHIAGGTDLAAFAAAEQNLETTAATAESALLAYSETRDGRSTLFAGLRGVDGSWRETKIGDAHHAPLAATDGSNFAVITTTSSNDWAASILDRRGRLVNVSSRIASFTPTGIAWTGSAYAVIGINSTADLAAYTVSPSAIVTGPVTLAQHRDGALIENPVIAARDGEVLVVWQHSTFVPCFPICDPYTSELHAARFSPSLQRIDADDLLIAPDEAIFPGAVWDGSRYTIAWNSHEKLQWRTLTSHGSVSGISEAVGLQPLLNHGPRLSVFEDGVAMTMTTGDVFVLTEGTTVLVPQLGHAGTLDAIFPLGNRIGYAQSVQHDEMPYHGADRLHLVVGDAIPIPAQADPPRITRAHYVGNTMEISWTHPLASVHGYRVEYRVNDGYWNELDAWFEADETTLEIAPWRGTNVTYQFRVRAISDAGTGAYSNAAVVKNGVRRRSVR